ncbi:MAG: MlrC C-terminal domain-containing protein, partial [Pseudomonadota bacterium]
ATGAALGVLWHPDAADAAHAAGAGGVIETTFGAGTGDAITAIARVVAVSDGVFTSTRAMQRDVVTDIGPSARLLLEPGGVEVIVSSRRHQCIDQQAFRHLGIDPAQRRIVAVKSTVHFRADFAPIARAVLNVEAPGLSVCRPERLDYRHLRPAMIPHP